MKNILMILTVISTLTFIGCGKAKKELAKNIIDSYSIANREQDKRMMEKLFPDIRYFENYPKADKISISNLKINDENVLVLCSLYYETDLGKNIEQELKFLVSTKDSIIIDVLGYLTRELRNQIIERWVWEYFTDLKPKTDDMDGKLVKNQTIAFNRLNGYEYFAIKAIGENTKVQINIKQKEYTKYYSKYYFNTKIDLTITNNSGFDCEYKYEDDNYQYQYVFPAFIKHERFNSLGSEGEFFIKSGESLTQSVIINGEYMFPIDKEKISIKPKTESIEIEKNKKIVDKYYDNAIKNEIIAGDYNYWNLYYNYKIILE